jgi:hypothetical protein
MEEVITAYFEIRSQTSGGTEEKRETPVSRSRLELRYPEYEAGVLLTGP